MNLRAEQLETALWASVGLAFLVLIYFLRPILTPFLAGAILAYILNPGVNLLERKKLPRWAGAILMVLALLVGLLMLVLIVAPLIHQQATQLSLHLPDMLARLNDAAAPRLKDWFGWEIAFDADSIKKLISDHWQSSDGLSERIFASLKLGGLALAGLVANLLLIPLVLFYLLDEWPRLIATLDRTIPRRWHDLVAGFANEIDSVLAQFLRGQVAVMILLSFYYSSRAVDRRRRFRIADRHRHRRPGVRSLPGIRHRAGAGADRRRTAAEYESCDDRRRRGIR